MFWDSQNGCIWNARRSERVPTSQIFGRLERVRIAPEDFVVIDRMISAIARLTNVESSGPSLPLIEQSHIAIHVVYLAQLSYSADVVVWVVRAEVLRNVMSLLVRLGWLRVNCACSIPALAPPLFRPFAHRGLDARSDASILFTRCSDDSRRPPTP